MGVSSCTALPGSVLIHTVTPWPSRVLLLLPLLPLTVASAIFRAPTLNLYVSHLRSVHAEDSDFYVECGIDGCVNKYEKCSSFISHVYRNHHEVLLLADSRSVSLPPPESDNPNREEELYGEELGTEIYQRSGEIGGATSLFDHSLHQILKEDYVQQQKRSALFLLNLK